LEKSDKYGKKQSKPQIMATNRSRGIWSEGVADTLPLVIARELPGEPGMENRSVAGPVWENFVRTMRWLGSVSEILKEEKDVI
jgi:hypothetical protein